MVAATGEAGIRPDEHCGVEIVIDDGSMTRRTTIRCGTTVVDLPVEDGIDITDRSMALDLAHGRLDFTAAGGRVLSLSLELEPLGSP